LKWTQHKILSWLSCFLSFARTKKMSTPHFSPAGGKVAPAGGKVLYRSLELLYRPLQILYRPLQLLQRAVKYFTARWSPERAVKWYFTARQSRKNRHVKKKRGRQCYKLTASTSVNA
jgi:hypothetical protein